MELLRYQHFVSKNDGVIQVDLKKSLHCIWWGFTSQKQCMELHALVPWFGEKGVEQVAHLEPPSAQVFSATELYWGLTAEKGDPHYN